MTRGRWLREPRKIKKDLTKRLHRPAPIFPRDTASARRRLRRLRRYLESWS